MLHLACKRFLFYVNNRKHKTRNKLDESMHGAYYILTCLVLECSLSVQIDTDIQFASESNYSTFMNS